MKRIYVDADACPVKDEVYRVGKRLCWQVFVVANQQLDTPMSRLIFTIVVSRGEDAADDYIAEKAGPGDVVITADIPLAARSLDKGARVLGPRGREFSEASIGDALASRALGQDLREAGIMTGGPAPMQPKDRSRFLGKLDEILHALQREHPEG